MNYKRVELKDGVYLQYVGVHALNWQQDWGIPQVGFVENDKMDNDIIKLKESVRRWRTRALMAENNKDFSNPMSATGISTDELSNNLKW